MKRYLYLPGVLILLTALLRATADAHWDRTGAGMAIAGVLIIAAAIALNWREVREWFSDPRGVFAVTTGLTVVVLVLVLAMVNVLVWYRPFRVDLTASGRNEVFEETRNILRNLPDGVTLRQFGRTRDPGVDQLLSTFAASGRVFVEFVDSDQQPRLTREYGVIKDGTVVVVAGSNYRKVENPTEQSLATALLQVTSTVERAVCFVSGHGERGVADESAGGLSRLAAAFQAANYKVTPVSLLETHVPPACSALVIAGPQQRLTPPEIDRLSKFADRSGRVAVLVDPSSDGALSDWLRVRGISPGAGMIVDTSGAGQTVGGGPETPLAHAYGNHPITRGFGISTLYARARPLDVVPQPQSGGKPMALARSGDRSYEETDLLQAPSTFDQGRDRTGPFTLAAVTTIKTGRGPSDEMRLAVFGDSDFISNALVARQGNRDLFLRTISWLVGEEEATIVSVPDRENRRVELSERQRVWMYAVNVLLLPGIPLVAGIVVLIRARR